MKNNDRMVVFVSALVFRFSRMPWADARLKQVARANTLVFRSGDEEQTDPFYVRSVENEDEGYEVECEVVGQSSLEDE